MLIHGPSGFRTQLREAIYLQLHLLWMETTPLQPTPNPKHGFGNVWKMIFLFGTAIFLGSSLGLWVYHVVSCENAQHDGNHDPLAAFLALSLAVGTSEVTFGTLLSVAAHAINVLPWTSPRQGS